MAAYQEEGLHIAAQIGNRGPIRLTDDGRLHPDILAAHWRQGFYVFEGLIDGDELAELRRDANEMLERAPVGPDGGRGCAGAPGAGARLRPPAVSLRQASGRSLGRHRAARWTSPDADDSAITRPGRARGRGLPHELHVPGDALRAAALRPPAPS